MSRLVLRLRKGEQLGLFSHLVTVKGHTRETEHGTAHVAPHIRHQHGKAPEPEPDPHVRAAPGGRHAPVPVEASPVSTWPIERNERTGYERLMGPKDGYFRFYDDAIKARAEAGGPAAGWRIKSARTSGGVGRFSVSRWTAEKPAASPAEFESLLAPVAALVPQVLFGIRQATQDRAVEPLVNWLEEHFGEKWSASVSVGGVSLTVHAPCGRGKESQKEGLLKILAARRGLEAFLGWTEETDPITHKRPRGPVVQGMQVQDERTRGGKHVWFTYTGNNSMSGGMQWVDGIRTGLALRRLSTEIGTAPERTIIHEGENAGRRSTLVAQGTKSFVLEWSGGEPYTNTDGVTMPGNGQLYYTDEKAARRAATEWVQRGKFNR